VLRRDLERLQAATAEARERGLPRLFLLDDEYREAMLKTKLMWVTALTGDLKSKKITWSEAWLRRVAATFEPAND
jgi:hypothetical protein